MTACSTSPSVGIAWLGKLCTKTSNSQVVNGVTQFVSGVGITAIVPIEWKVTTHEIGHSFGSEHDCTSVSCGSSCTSVADTCNCLACGTGTACDCQGKYVMHPLDNSVTTGFSPASVARICSTFSTRGTCLLDPTAFVSVSSGVCGNGNSAFNSRSSRKW